MQLDLAHVPVSEDAHERTLRDLLSRRANGHRDEPEPGDGGANPTSLKVTTRRPLTVTEVAFPLLVNDHERPSPDGATQGSSV